MYDVFISYSTKDSAVADAVCHILEENKIKCWYAGRRSGAADLMYGYSYPGEIVRGIRKSKIVVLIFSKFSNTSKDVLNEMEIAKNEGKLVIPFRIENAELSEDMYYYVKRLHWLDALTEPREKEIGLLLEKVKHLLSLPSEGQPIDEVLEESQDELSMEIKKEAEEIADFLDKGKVKQAKQHTFHFLSEAFYLLQGNQEEKLTIDQMEAILNSSSHFSNAEDRKVGTALYELVTFIKEEGEEELTGKTAKYQQLLQKISNWYERKTTAKPAGDINIRDKSPSKDTVNNTTIIKTTIGDVNAPLAIGGNVNIQTHNYKK